jgi:SAM-dependent methyltransferase
MSPLSEARAGRLVRFLSDGLDGTVVDIGCGWAELLLRVVAAAPGCRGFGVDREDARIAHAAQLAAERGLADRVTLVAGDAGVTDLPMADAVICIGASQVWFDGALTKEPLDYRRALQAIRKQVVRRGRVAYGEGIWTATPTPAATAPMGGRDDEYVTLAEVVDLAVECGFEPLGVHEATLDEWDEFESGFTAPWGAWLAAHDPDDPGADEARAGAASQRAAYLHGYRGILGMGYLELVAV